MNKYLLKAYLDLSFLKSNNVSPDLLVNVLNNSKITLSYNNSQYVVKSQELSGEGVDVDSNTFDPSYLISIELEAKNLTEAIFISKNLICYEIDFNNSEVEDLFLNSWINLVELRTNNQTVFEDLINDYLNEKNNVSYNTGHYFNHSNLDNYVIEIKPTWSVEKQSVFIKTFLIGFPVQFKVLERKTKPVNKFYLLEGQEEFFAIKSFLNNKLILNDKILLEKFNNLKYENMPSQIKREFLEKISSIRVIYFSKKTTPLFLKMKNF